MGGVGVGVGGWGGDRVGIGVGRLSHVVAGFQNNLFPNKLVPAEIPFSQLQQVPPIGTSLVKGSA